MFSSGILRNPRNLRNPQAIPRNPGHLKFGWDTSQILEEFPQVSVDIPQDSSRKFIPWNHSRGILKEPYSIVVSYPDVLCPNRVCRQVFVPSLKFDGKDMPQNVWCISTVRPPITLCHGLVTVAIMPVQSCQGYPPPCMPAIYQIKNCYTH